MKIRFILKCFQEERRVLQDWSFDVNHNSASHISIKFCVRSETLRETAYYHLVGHYILQISDLIQSWIICFSIHLRPVEPGSTSDEFQNAITIAPANSYDSGLFSCTVMLIKCFRIFCLSSDWCYFLKMK